MGCWQNFFYDAMGAEPVLRKSYPIYRGWVLSQTDWDWWGDDQDSNLGDHRRVEVSGYYWGAVLLRSKGNPLFIDTPKNFDEREFERIHNELMWNTEERGHHPLVVLIGSKSDIMLSETVEKLKEKADTLNMNLFLTSSKENVNIEEVVTYMSKEILKLQA